MLEFVSLSKKSSEFQALHYDRNFNFSTTVNYNEKKKIDNSEWLEIARTKGQIKSEWIYEVMDFPN